MDLDDESSNSDNEPRLHGLEAFDFDYQYAEIASLFGMDAPRRQIGHLQQLTSSDMNDMILKSVVQSGIVLIFAYAGLNTIIYNVLFRVLKSKLATSLFDWSIDKSNASIIIVHLGLLLCVYLIVFRKFERDLRVILACLSIYVVPASIAHNIFWIWKLVRRPSILALVSVFILYAFGIIHWTAARCKLFLILSYDKIWVIWVDWKRRRWITYQRYTRNTPSPSPNGASRYNYEPLKSSEIRLLEISRSHPLANLSFRLINSSLPRPMSYEALSYTWGDPTLNHSIIINDKYIYITQHASQALEALAPVWGSRLIWIDSICINQENNLEKGQQVALMADIYRSAQRTIAWLGDSAKAPFAFLQLRRLHRLLSSKQQDEESEAQSVIQKFQLNTLEADDFQHWHAVSEFLAHDYWARVWIVQEVAVSRKIDILYGLHYIPLDSVTNVIGLLWENTSQRELLLANPWKFHKLEHGMISNYANIRMTLGFRNLVQAGRHIPLLDAVQATFLFQASNQLDKIYAFCNISQSPQGVGLDPDYTISPQEAFVRFGKHYMNEGHISYLLQNSGHSTKPQLCNLPSWVPDLSASDDIYQLFMRKQRPLKDEFTASGEEPAIVTVDSKNRLQVKGIQIDVISYLSMTAITEIFKTLLESGADTHVLFPPIIAWHNDAVALATENLPRRYRCYDESRRQAFLRTIIEDRNAKGAEAAVVFKKFYRSWCNVIRVAAMEESYPVAGHSKEEDERLRGAQWFAAAVSQVVRYRRKFAVTREGFMAIVPEETDVGDVISVILGVNVPLVLRPISITAQEQKKEQVYELVGWCYCHGIMLGEAVEGNQQTQTFVIR